MRGLRRLRRRLNTRIANGIEVWRREVEEEVDWRLYTLCARDVFVVWARWSTHV